MIDLHTTYCTAASHSAQYGTAMLNYTGYAGPGSIVNVHCCITVACFTVRIACSPLRASTAGV